MTDNAFVEDGNIGCAATNVHQSHTGCLVAIVQHSIGRCDRLKHNSFDTKTCLGNGITDIAHVVGIASNNVEIGHQAFARHAYWVDVAVKFVVIDDIVLGEYMDDFLTRIEHDAVLLFDEAVNIGFLDKAMVLSNHYASLVGAAFDVLARNADIDFIDIILGHF